MDYNDDMRNAPRYPDAENNLYHSGPSYARNENAFEDGDKKKHSGSWGKIVALCLVCALMGGVLGAGGIFLLQKKGAFGRNRESSIYVSNREAVQIKEKMVQGEEELSDSEIYNMLVESVVSINSSTSTTNVFGQVTKGASSGTGFVITEDGYILTNYHVVEGAKTIEVTLYDENTYEATFIGGDEDYDIAVLKIDVQNLPAVVMGNSDQVGVGDHILVIGNPLGELTFSASGGLVSCCNRMINVDGTPFNTIQVDASVNPGNSGGPLINVYGEVIGIISAKYSSYASTSVEGLGFAIPINDVISMVKDLVENGAITNKPYIGIQCSTMNRTMASQYSLTQGVYVNSVEEGGAAERAGIQEGDIITKFNDTEIASLEELNAAKKYFFAGDTVKLTIYRDKEYMTVDLTFDSMPVEKETEEKDPQEDPQERTYTYDEMMEYFRNMFGDFGWGNGWGNGWGFGG